MIQTTSMFKSSGLKTFDARDVQPMKATTSKGNQDKWFIDNKYVKSNLFYQEKYWQDNKCEVIGSTICEQLGINVIHQELCSIVTNSEVLNGVYSENFTDSSREFLTYSRLLNTWMTKRLFRVGSNRTPVESLKVCLRVYKDVCHLDAREYLRNMFYVDYLIGNEDRHINNFGIIFNHKTKKFEFPPLFDFGLSLFEHDKRYITDEELGLSLEKMTCAPFSSNQETQISAVYDVLGGFKSCIQELEIDEKLLPNELARMLLDNRSRLLGLTIKYKKE